MTQRERQYEQEILVQLGTMTAELAHLREAVDEVKAELQRQRETQVTRPEHEALKSRIKDLEEIEVQFAEFRATVRTAMGLGGSGAVAGAIGTVLHFFG